MTVRKCLPQRVTAFTQDAISLTAGEELRCGDRLNVFTDLRRQFCKWLTKLDSSGLKCTRPPFSFVGPQLSNNGTLKHKIVCLLQLTGGLKKKWRSMRRDTVEENCQGSSTTRPLSLWSRSRSKSWRNQLLRYSRMWEVYVAFLECSLLF